MSRVAELKENLRKVQSEIEQSALAVGRDSTEIKLIVVTKTFPISDIEILYELGIRDFGENRDQEGSVKAPALPDDAIWHFQGQIQSNKLKSIASWADYVHSIDEIRHAKVLNAATSDIKIFTQVSLDQISLDQVSSDPAEKDRGGVAPAELGKFIDDLAEFNNLNLVGLMAVAPVGENPDLAFSRLAQIRQGFPKLKFLSAGMSGDFKSAIAHGATHLRIGSQILGVR